jgi:hypothetical protein
MFSCLNPPRLIVTQKKSKSENSRYVEFYVHIVGDGRLPLLQLITPRPAHILHQALVSLEIFHGFLPNCPNHAFKCIYSIPPYVGGIRI